MALRGCFLFPGHDHRVDGHQGISGNRKCGCGKLSEVSIKIKSVSVAEGTNYEPLLRSHMPELDTIRGLAILGVLLYHGLYWLKDLHRFVPWQSHVLFLMSAGQFGVNLFFVLSGFLITGILLDTQGRPDYFERFYFRRILRILPAYYLTLFLLIVFQLTSRGFLLMSMAYASNLSPLLGIPLSYTVLWSLAVEEHFYMAWPAAVKHVASSRLLWILGAVFLLCPVSRLLYHMHAVHTNTVGSGYGFYSWNNADGLALGAIIAILARKPGWDRRLGKFAIALFSVACVIACIGYPFGILTRRTPLGDALQYSLWNLSFGALLILFLRLARTPWRRVVRLSPLIFLGDISYGLYLYHLMVFLGYDWLASKTGFAIRMGIGIWGETWIRMIAVGSVSILIAYLSRRYFEEPFLRLKDRSPWTLFRNTAGRAPRVAHAPDVIVAGGEPVLDTGVDADPRKDSRVM